jgi:plasmid stabilization system protein ParE
MAYRVYFTDQAQNDFHSIIDFIAADNPTRALSFVDELLDRSTMILSQFPNSGRTIGTARYIVLDNYCRL